MSGIMSGGALSAVNHGEGSATALSEKAKSSLTKLAAWVQDRDIPFLTMSIAAIVMLLWAGSYKFTALGAEGIVPLVSNGPSFGGISSCLARI